MVVIGGALLLRTKVRTDPRRGLCWLRTTTALRLSCSDFRDDVGVILGGHRSAHQRLHGAEAVNRVLHSAMAAVLELVAQLSYKTA